jgi:hypothetical protein
VLDGGVHQGHRTLLGAELGGGRQRRDGQRERCEHGDQNVPSPHAGPPVEALRPRRTVHRGRRGRLPPSGTSDGAIGVLEEIIARDRAESGGPPRELRGADRRDDHGRGATTRPWPGGRPLPCKNPRPGGREDIPPRAE